ncbi:MAG: hypothetical protein ACRCXY_08635 [Fusobacteriaceae bacterium]
MLKKESFGDVLRESYPKDILFKLFKTYFLEWIAEGFIGSNLGLFEISMITENSNHQTFIDLIDQMYKPQNFEHIYSILPEEIQTVYNNIAWNGKHYIKDNRKQYLKQENSFNIVKDLKDEYLFFKAEKDYKKEEYLTLDYEIIRRIRKLLPNKPKDYVIVPVENPYTAFKSNDEKVFMENIKLYYDFYKQGGLSLSTSGKILKESKISMKKYCNINEYYDEENKDLQYLKTETIALFFYLMKDDFLNYNTFKVSNIKDLVLSFLSGDIIKDEKFHYCFLYLNYLKGLKNIENSDEKIKRGLGTILKIIKEFPATTLYDPTISIHNIVKRIVLQDDFIEIIDLEIASNSLYINEANYERTRITCYDKYLSYIITPFVKSVFFILGTLGVVELMYDHPSSNNCLYLKNGHLSKYDGLKFVKLTEFGKYIFGIVDEYDFKDLKEEGEVHLDEDHLIVTILGEAPSKSMFFEKISQKISHNKFKISHDTFLKDISTTEDLEKRILAFKEKITGFMFSHWETFFEDLITKSDFINIIPEYLVLKLKDDSNLLSILSKDSRFKPLFLKGENYHIIVKNSDFDKLSLLFKEYGYNINSKDLSIS